MQRGPRDAVSRHKGGVLSTVSFRQEIDEQTSVLHGGALPGTGAVSFVDELSSLHKLPALKEMEELLIAEALKTRRRQPDDCGSTSGYIKKGAEQSPKSRAIATPQSRQETSIVPPINACKGVEHFVFLSRFVAPCSNPCLTRVQAPFSPNSAEFRAQTFHPFLSCRIALPLLLKKNSHR